MLGVVTLHSPSCNAPGCEEREEVSSSLLMSSMPSSEADTSVQTFLACAPLAERQNFRFCFVIPQSYFVFAQPNFLFAQPYFALAKNNLYLLSHIFYLLKPNIVFAQLCFVSAQPHLLFADSYFLFAQKTSYLPYLGLDVLHTGLRLSLCLRSLQKFSFLEKKEVISTRP